MTDLLLVTPVLRCNNLIFIAKNIFEIFKDEKEIHPVWVLCFDRYNSDYTPLKFKKLEVFLLEHNIEYYVYYQGKEGTPNFGGALMNEPMKDIKENKYKDSNPLMMVLDDDNILHNNLLMTIKHHLLNNENSLWLNMVDELGAQRFVRYADRLAYINGEAHNAGYRIIHRCATCDPSQFIMRLDTFLYKLEGFAESVDYDFRLMDAIYRNKNKLAESITYQGTWPWIPNKDFYISCYHNGLVTGEKLEKTIKDIDNAEYRDSYVRVHVGENIFVLDLDNEELKEILQKKLNKFNNKTS